MPDIKPPISLPLPDRTLIDAVVVTLPSGKKVVRSTDELTRAPKK